MPRHPLYILIAMASAMMALAPAMAHGENFARGQELYEDQCQACHNELLHRGKDRRVQTLSDLRKQIASWASHAGQDWGKSEIDDVLQYMNKSFYHFKDKEL